MTLASFNPRHIKEPLSAGSLLSSERNIWAVSGGLWAGEVVNRYGTDGRLRFHVRDRWCRLFPLWIVDGKNKNVGEKGSQDACSRNTTLERSLLRYEMFTLKSHFVLEVERGRPCVVTLEESLRLKVQKSFLSLLLCY